VLDRLEYFQSTYEEQAIVVGGEKWRYRRTGASDRPLVMLPGIQGGGSVFFDVAVALAGKVDILTVTAPPLVDPEAMADSQAEFLTALGIECADMFGSSLGGYLLQVFGIRHPHRLAQVFLANTFADAGPFLSKAPSLDTIAAQPPSQVMEEGLRPMLDSPASDPGQVAMQTVMRMLVGLVQTAEEYKARMMTLLGSTAIGRIPISDEKIIVIDDDADPSILPEMRCLIRARYASAQQYMIARGGHLPAIQRPSAVVSVLLNRIGGVG
jgi:pimeloyl-ACP methyl ester carboxylesterase